MKRIEISYFFLGILVSSICVESAQQAYRRDPGHPTWHHGAFQDVKDSVRSDLRRMLHSRAEVPFQVPLEVNVVLIGFNGDGGYRYTVDSLKLEEFLRVAFPSHRPSCLETSQPLDIEHHVVFNVFPAGQPELIALEKAVKAAMKLVGTAREVDFGREVPLYGVEATAVEPEFEKLYSYLFDIENGGYPVEEMDRPRPTAIFVVNFDKVRIDPRNSELDLDNLMNGRIPHLNEEELKKQAGGYIYRYRYNGGGASQIWLGSGRFVVIDLSAGPCTYGKIETEEGSVNPKTLPRLQNVVFPRPGAGGEQSAHDIFFGQLSAAIATTVEHVIAPDVRYETVDMTTRLLVPIIVLQNHNRYNIMVKGHNYSLDVDAIEAEVKKMVHQGQEVVIVGGTHALHRHEKLAIAVSKAMRGHSLQETKTDGRFHVHTKTYLDGAILKEEMERSADVLAAGLLEVSDPNLSSKFFLRQTWMDDTEGTGDSILKHKPLWASYGSKHQKNKRWRSEKKKQGELFRTYGTRVVPVFVLSLADVDDHLMMEDESLVWTSNDVVIVLQHETKKIPLNYVSELDRRHAVPVHAQRHILAGLASVVGGLSAPYEKASHAHERPVVNWLLAAGCHPFGPFSNTSQISQLLRDVALRNSVYARVDAALHRIRDTSESVQAFAAEHLKTPLGEPVKGKKNKSSTELWLEKFYKKKTNLPEPFPHELVERLEKYLDSLEEQLVELSSLLYDHRLQDANLNSSEILQSSMFTQQYVDHVLSSEREKMKCCSIEYKVPTHYSQNYIYAGILLAGFFVYFAVIFFASPVR
ncbi:transmembrane protein [Perilla frutescens var. hirtella]|nr:transmembrane protein [Perilla frutescens var. hirtella]KAH6816759.1 transmembrane protein [Perilla frutescens var. frutescens]